jgi:hypothetical protein
MEERHSQQLIAECAPTMDYPNLFLISFITVLVRRRKPIGKGGE